MNKPIADDPEGRDKNNALNADVDAARNELAAAGIAYDALAKLGPDARERALRWLHDRLQWSKYRPPWGTVGTSDEEPPF